VALFGGAHVPGHAEAGEQVLAGVLAQERLVRRVVHLVAHHADRHLVARRVVGVLPVHAHPAQGRLAHQERAVEPGEQARGERVGTRGHVDHYVLVVAVEQVVEDQLHRADLRVVAGHPQVLLGEPAGDR
jgi:hypothetical protein